MHFVHTASLPQSARQALAEEQADHGERPVYTGRLYVPDHDSQNDENDEIEAALAEFGYR